MSKAKNKSFFAIEGWMGNELGLKHSLLKVYALIYSFSKDGTSEFTGSWSYLASCIGNSSKPTVNHALKTLVARGYIIRRDEKVNGKNRPCYKVNPVVKIFNGGGKIFSIPMVKKISSDGKKILSHTSTYTATFDISIHNIVEYLNAKAGTNYKATTELTRREISSKLLEGFTCEDFYTVIDKKVSEWMGTEMQKYLRPSTLFGSKFENYLNAPLIKAQAPKTDEGQSTFDTDEFFGAAVKRCYAKYLAPDTPSDKYEEDGDTHVS